MRGGCFDSKNTELIGDFFEKYPFLKNIDVLVNNAGISDHNVFGNITEAEYDSVMDTNLKAVYFLSQYVCNIWIANGTKGRILNIASSSSLRPSTLPYTLSKNGIVSLTKGLAKKMIKHGIIVNAIAPGQTATNMISIDSDMSAPRSPIDRLVSPNEIANMSVIMASSLCDSVIGDCLYMTGGSGIIKYDDIDY